MIHECYDDCFVVWWLYVNIRMLETMVYALNVYAGQNLEKNSKVQFRMHDTLPYRVTHIPVYPLHEKENSTHLYFCAKKTFAWSYGMGHIPMLGFSKKAWPCLEGSTCVFECYKKDRMHKSTLCLYVCSYEKHRGISSLHAYVCAKIKKKNVLPTLGYVQE